MPNVHGHIIPEAVRSTQTISTSYNSNPQGVISRVQMQHGRILGLDSSNNAVGLFGFDSTGAMAVKVAKSGYDARTASDANLIFNSNQDTFKIATTVSYTFSFTASSYNAGTQYTIAHNLGYVPYMQGYAILTTVPESSTGTFPLPYIATVAQTPTIPAAFLIGAIITVQGVDSTNIYVGVGIGSSGSTLAGTLKFYVLQETAT